MQFTFNLILSLSLITLLCGCKAIEEDLELDYSPRSGSYEASNLDNGYYLRIAIAREGFSSPKYHIGPIRLLKGDYRGALMPENPTFSEDAIIHVLDEEKKTLGSYELHFDAAFDDDEFIQKLMNKKAIPLKRLSIDYLYIPYSQNIRWLLIQKPLVSKKAGKLIPFKHSKILQDLPLHYRTDRESTLDPISKDLEKELGEDMEEE